MRRLLSNWLPVVVWAGLIFFLSSQPDLPHVSESLLDILARKGFHFLEYAVLAWLLQRASRTTNQQTFRPYFYSLGMAFFYAVSDEYHQSFIPQRTPSPLDVAIDSLGAAAALVVAWATSAKWHKRLH